MTGRFPLNLPEIPPDVLSRFPSLTKFWGDGMAQWHEEFKRSLTDDLTTLIDALASHADSIASLTAQLAALQELVAALQLQLEGLEPDDCTDVEQDLAALLATVTQHIEAIVAHGSNGAVAGLNDISGGVTIEELVFYA